MKVLSPEAISGAFIYQVQFDLRVFIWAAGHFLMIDDKWENKLNELTFVPHICFDLREQIFA